MHLYYTYLYLFCDFVLHYNYRKELARLRKDSVTSLLTEGTIINTKLSSSNVWLQNIIYKSDNHSVYISLLNEYLENIIMVGQTIVIKLTNEHNEFVFDGLILEIHPEFPSYVSVNVIGIKSQKNIRVFPRYDVYLASMLKVEPLEEESFAVIHNISLVGMAFYSKDDFHPSEDNVKATIYLADDKILNAAGRINRKQPSIDYIEYALQFTEMQEETSNMLSSYFSVLETDRSFIREDFFNCIKKHL